MKRPDVEIGTSNIIMVIVLKSTQLGLHCSNDLKIADGMANSVDWSDCSLELLQYLISDAFPIRHDIETTLNHLLT